MRCRASIAVVATATLSAMAVPSMATAAAPSAGTAASSPIVAPKSGKRLASHLVRLVVRAPDDLGSLDARLNGVKVGEEFGPVRRGLRTLTVSVSHGLRRGRNVLRVRVRVPGRKDRTATRRFVVTTKGQLVGAGRDRRIVVGTRVRLGGRVVHPAGRRARGGVRWRRVGSSSAGSRRPLASVSRPRSLGATFRATTPGRHTVRMTLGGRSDDVTVIAMPASALQNVDTGVTNAAGKPAMRVGDDVYVAPLASDAGAKTFVHVLVFKRESLQFVSNSAYTEIGPLADALAPLTEAHLVIVALRTNPAFAVAPPYNVPGDRSLAAVLGRIGFPSPSVVGGLSDRAGGTVSAIGVPGMKPGEADVNLDPRGGALKGYLLPDRFMEYGFVSPDPKQFTQPLLPGGACTADCDAGFVVSILDAYSLGVVDKRTFATNPQSGPNVRMRSNDAVIEMHQYLTGVPGGRLVHIEVKSRWAPGSREWQSYVPPIATGATGPGREAMAALAAAVASVGGTRDGFNRAAIQSSPGGGQPVYTLVGWAGAGEAGGAEVAMNVNGAGPFPRFSTTLRRDRGYRFRPVHATASGATPDAIQDLVLSPPGKTKWWPAGEPGAAGLKRALAYIGGESTDLGCDPQAHFWLQLDDESDVSDARGDVDDATMPTTGTTNPCTGRAYAADDFTSAQFDAAQTELKNELDAVSHVRKVMSKYATPFDGTAGLKGWADVQTLADGIWTSAQSPDGKAELDWVEFTEILLKLAGPLTGHFSAVAAELLQFGDWVAGAADRDGSPSGDEVRVQANELGEQIVDQAEAQAVNLRRLGDVVVSDYDKLKKFCRGGASCPAEFKAPDATAQAKATAATSRAVRRFAYAKLLPLGYRLNFPNPYPDNRYVENGQQYYGDQYGFPHNNGTVPPDPGRYDCGSYSPFRNWPSQAMGSMLRILSPTDQRNNQWQTVVVIRSPGGWDVHAVPPPDEMLHDMFGAVPESNDPKAPGLGMSLADLTYTSRIWGWRDYDHPASDSGCVWDIP